MRLAAAVAVVLLQNLDGRLALQRPSLQIALLRRRLGLGMVRLPRLPDCRVRWRLLCSRVKKAEKERLKGLEDLEKKRRKEKKKKK